MKSYRSILAGIITASLVFMAGCNEDILKDETGRIIVRMTDDPFRIEFVEWAKITISKIEIRTQADFDSVKYITLSDKTNTYDLIKLRNGVTEELVSAELPIGTYDEIRLITAEASLKIKDGGEFTVKIPSGSQTGIKVLIKPAVKVEGGLTSELLIDFDLSKSFVLKGNTNKPDGINGFNFKPVIRAVNNSTVGTIEGMVTDVTLKKLINATVWVRKDTVIATAYTDTLGKYVLPGIPAGIYIVGAWKEKYDSLEFAGVGVSAGNKTTRNIALKPE